jgi:hypothetical protein
MHLSHRHRFVFLAVAHAASTSVGRFLAPYSDIESVRRHRTTPERPFFHHMSATEARSVFAERGWEWDGYRHFCVVRNPFDRMVSMYHFGRKLRWREGAGVLMNLRRTVGTGLRVTRSFREFVLGFSPEEDRFLSLRKFICDVHGVPLVEDVLRFEELHESLPAYLSSLGVPVGSNELPRMNPSHERRHYRDYYDDETRRHVEALFAYEFERFGYAF